MRTLNLNQGRCIYTGKPANSADHVPPKCLLAKPLPGNLATVPCDRDFNSSFAHDEQYFLMVLASITVHPAVARRVADGGDVDRALSASPDLDDRLINKLQTGKYGRVSIRPETHRIDRVLKKLSAGAYFLKFMSHGTDAFESLGLHSIAEPPDEIAALSYDLQFFEDIHIVQWSIFSYGFARGPNAAFICALNFYDAFFAQ